MNTENTFPNLENLLFMIMLMM